VEALKDGYLRDPDPETLDGVRGQVARFLGTLRAGAYFDGEVRARLF